VKKILSAGCIAYLALSFVAGAFIADVNLKLPRLPLRHQQAAAAVVQTNFQAELQNVSITAFITRNGESGPGIC
jgi:hypothetical protein